MHAVLQIILWLVSIEIDSNRTIHFYSVLFVAKILMLINKTVANLCAVIYHKFK